jgi:uncharacterized membrane protein HdeD (DUF308 family)
MDIKQTITTIIAILILALGVYLMTFKFVQYTVLFVLLGWLGLFAIAGLCELIYPFVERLFKK